MKFNYFIILFSSLLFQCQLVYAGDVFDKAESAKDCVQNNNCGGNKWLRRAMAMKKCQQEGNCIEKTNEYVSNNQEKIKNVASNAETIGKCMNLTDPDELKKCYEMTKTHYKNRQAKKEKAAQLLRELANERKTQGDAVCLPGKIAAGLVKMQIKGFVEQVNGDRIQIRIADTEGQEPSYQGVSLRQGTIIWDPYNNWIHCKYLKK